MELNEYFETATGMGILSTADKDGKVDAAIYSRPHFLDGGKLAFIMRDRLSHSNLQSNPHAAYLFIENGPGYKGKRLYLTMVKEEKNAEQITSLQRRKRKIKVEEDRFLVFFELDRERPLVGD
ncbi:MAG: pyridoxamine 5'-phosphate oxidase family protein [Deltaproteobacteria bacterium]|nr:pyridoxamine 5'-phosphate oxidase family protein [Deltaproteobacteria bacterium]